MIYSLYGAVVVLFGAVILYLMYFNLKMKFDHARAIEQIESVHNLDIERIRKESGDLALTRSRRVLKGQIAEHLAPMLMQFRGQFLAEDMRFLGMPLDFLIFSGYSAARDTDAEMKEIIFVDIKTGNAKLSDSQEKIKRVVQQKKVRWMTIRMDDKGKVTIE